MGHIIRQYSASVRRTVHGSALEQATAVFADDDEEDEEEDDSEAVELDGLTLTSSDDVARAIGETENVIRSLSLRRCRLSDAAIAAAADVSQGVCLHAVQPLIPSPAPAPSPT